MKKYEILMDEKNNTIVVYGKTLHRIKALRDFGDVRKGDIGGYIENENNLSHEGNCWIYDDAMVYGNAKVYGNARVYNNAIVNNNAIACGNAIVYDNAKVYSNAIVNDIKIQGIVATKFDDIIEIQNPKGRLVTCTLHGNEILYSVGCQIEITEERFKYRIEHEDGGLENNPHRKYYYKIIEMAKLYFDVK